MATTHNDSGPLPLTRAVQEVAAVAGCTRAVAKSALAAVGPCNWIAGINYYRPAAAVAWLAARAEIAKLPEDWQARMQATRNRLFKQPDSEELTTQADSAFAAEYGVDLDALLTEYYDEWNHI